MKTREMTIGETAGQLHGALRDYIEAAYHISDPTLVEQRRLLLEQPGVIHQRPYLESTPRYEEGSSFGDLGLDEAVLDIFAAVSKKDGNLAKLVHDPPYRHQADSVRFSLVEGRSLVVMTGTGSGKTECFLLPALGKLAREARNNGRNFGETPAVRAMVLYPMNALVNDQLGRLRLLFGDPRIVEKFTAWAGRPARFARYTSRTLYPGVRTREKDKIRLTPIERYYVRHMERARDTGHQEREASETLIGELKRRGKWPVKPDLIGWYGEKNSRWRDSRTGEFRRCVTLPGDPELFTRHEVQAAPPDLLVTNYSMLEYMLMRPLERPVFDLTRDWLRANPRERFLLVVDEAHLYRGAGGAEVALLVRRLRARLDIPPERLQVICTSASFEKPERAAAFAAQLTGKEPGDFETVTGKLRFRPGAAKGTAGDAEALDSIDLRAFYEAETDEKKAAQVEKFLEYRGSGRPFQSLERALHDSLDSFAPMAELVNATMTAAEPVEGLGEALFEEVAPDLAARAATNLVAIGSAAKPAPEEPGMLPCRVHSFHRGLPGLWICMDSRCAELPESLRGGPAGRLFGQPRDKCGCGARVLELYTCRNCGTAYARAYTAAVDEPDFLWPEPGGALLTAAGEFGELSPLDLLLEEPVFADRAEPAEYDLVTGRLNPFGPGSRTRRVYLRRERLDPPGEEEEDAVATRGGEFRPCAVCGKTMPFGRSYVQDHQTKGDEPFRALVARQVRAQHPRPAPATRFAPLRGRKVLIFSDSRQTAARLAPNLQTYSTRDALRPLIVSGYGRLALSEAADFLSLEDLYLGVLTAAETMNVRLRPELKHGETFGDEALVEKAVENNVFERTGELTKLLLRLRSSPPPESLLLAIVKALADPYFGLEPLALASLVEQPGHSPEIRSLPEIPNLAVSDEEKTALARVWLRCWLRPGFWLGHMPAAWQSRHVKSHSGSFAGMRRFIGQRDERGTFDKTWRRELLRMFAERTDGNRFRLMGRELSLAIGGEWVCCGVCRTAQRPFPGKTACVDCGREETVPMDPDADPVFSARKGYYRADTLKALENPPVPPVTLIAAEHTAQLNAAQEAEVFSKAEEYELLFQDVDLGKGKPAVDVLSCTTTMEVGIDIGALSGVALRNMPPARANYQQRTGRAGRRGNAVATATAFGSADSHDEHYFTHPERMIKGKVNDPALTLDNPEIARRHVTAHILQRYHRDRLPDIAPQDKPHLFAVLGTVSGFKDRSNILNRADLERWLLENEDELRRDVSEWLPDEIDPEDRGRLVGGLVGETLRLIDRATDRSDDEGAAVDADEPAPDAPEEAGGELSSADPSREKLLDRLLYKGVLPRYAFPTDVAAFHVFDRDESTSHRHAFRFTPSQGLSVALSQYAPGKNIWIDNSLWTSGAIYSPIKGERYGAWRNRRFYYECGECGHARTVPLNKGKAGETTDCEACGGEGTFGPPKQWLRPPGFAHPVNVEERTSPDDAPEPSRATRAKLTAGSPEPNEWAKLNDRVRAHHMREYLLVTNRGPRGRGYSYCRMCGLIEPTVSRNPVTAGEHPKPYPDPDEPVCPGGNATRGLVLGTDFISDVLLASVSVAAASPPLTLRPRLLSTNIALRTVSEALSKAACARLELEADELQAGYRAALTHEGREGREAEIYLYDTLAGGAGFSRRVFDLGLSAFEDALEILETCPDGCDRSCYRCLRSYKNKFEHDLLDRHVGASLLRFLVRGEHPSPDPERLEASTDLLFEDLLRQNIESITVERNRSVTPPGLGREITAPVYARRRDGAEFVVALHGPLTPDDPPNDDLRGLRESDSSVPLLLQDEIVVRRNLPAATGDLVSKIKDG